jgi:DNA replicative helicase MCM subunit Mcm2 (Cdc46/Mcm family)
LLSRFDLILILRDEPNVEWDKEVTYHIMLDFMSADTSTTPNTLYGDDLWDLEKIQAHFMALQEIDPQLTEDAKKVLTNYYKFCRSESNVDRDQSRTSIRLLDSLYRLAQAHAR